MATLVEPNGKRSEVVPKNGEKFTLEEMQSLVGGYIEMIRVPAGPVMVINEEGKLLNLPKNNEATGWGLLAGIANEDFIAGNALLCFKNEADD